MKRWWSVLVVGSLVVLPLVLAGVWLHQNDRWAPTFDLAMTEVRVREVGTSHTPLLGLPGRLGRGDPASHPGPLSFYLLAPVYRLLGGSAWALRASTLTFNALAVVSALIIARRRAGTPAVVATGLLLALLELGYGPQVLTQPWNPYLPVLWFPVFLLAVWSVACADLPMLPVAAACGSLCAQTHIPYLAMCGGIGLGTLTFVAVGWARDWRRGVQDPLRVRYLLAAVAAVLVLWAPPLLQQWTHERGNFSVLIDYFANPPEAQVGLRSATELALARLDAWHLIVGSFGEPAVISHPLQVGQANPKRGAVFLAFWLASIPVAVKLGKRALLALHAVVAISLFVVLVAFSRIIGASWNYLLFSAWAIGGMLLFATSSTFGLAAWHRMSERVRRWTRLLPALGIAGAGAAAVRLAFAVDQAEGRDPNPMMQLAALAPPTAEAIRRGVGAATGAEGCYLVTWVDALYSGGQGLGLANELERRGIRAGVSKEYGIFLGKHWVVEPKDAVARIHLATGGWIADVHRIPGAIQIAYFDPRDAKEREEFSRHRETVFAALRALGREDAVGRFDRDHSAANVPGVTLRVGLTLMRMGQLGVPAAVFVMPVPGR